MHLSLRPHSLLPPGLLYFLSSTCYISLTNRPLGLSLPCTRGPNFAMPPHSRFLPLPPGYEPTAKEAGDAVVETWLATHDEPGGGDEEGETLKNELVFGGLGEPLLRLDVLKDTITRIKESGVRPRGGEEGDTEFRVITNGLVWDVDGVTKEIEEGERLCRVFSGD